MQSKEEVKDYLSLVTAPQPLFIQLSYEFSVYIFTIFSTSGRYFLADFAFVTAAPHLEVGVGGGHGGTSP